MIKFTPIQNKKFWDNYAKRYGRDSFGAHSDKHIVELENRFIISRLDDVKPTSLLDIGCGNGKRTLLFSKYVKSHVLGIDYAPEMIKESNLLLSRQNKRIQNKVSFEVSNVHKISEKSFDAIVSCRCFINQPSTKMQVRLFEVLHNLLNRRGSLIIAEESMNGIRLLNSLRRKYGLQPIKIRWYNLPIYESKVFPAIRNLFDIKTTQRLGIYHYISRVIHPALVYPQEPQPSAKINYIAMNSETILNNAFAKIENPFEKFGVQLLVHLLKK